MTEELEENNGSSTEEEVEVSGEDTTAPDSTINNLEDALKALSKARKEAAGRRIKNKEIEEYANKWKEHLDSQKTELERLTEANNQLATEMAILKYNLDPDLSEFLTGSPEEIEAKASKLAEKSSKKEGTPPPKVDFFAGQRGQAVAPKSETLNDWFTQMWKEADEKSSKRNF